MSKQLAVVRSVQKQLHFHTHLFKMECRNDITIENGFINAKIAEAAKPRWTRTKQKVLINQKRFYYLFGFIAVCSLGKFYDYICESSAIRGLTLMLRRQPLPPTISEMPKQMSSDEQTEELMRIFNLFDMCTCKGRFHEVTAIEMEQLFGVETDTRQQFVNLEWFVRMVKQSQADLDTVKSKLGSKCKQVLIC